MPRSLTVRLALLAAPMLLGSASAEPPSPARLTVRHDETARIVTVTAGDDVFTTLHYNAFAKPIFWPIRGPGGVSLTRDWPMKPDTAGDDKDHPHHKSLWFTHGNVNGVDFWAESEKSGKVVTTKITRAEAQPDGQAVIEFDNEWRGPDGQIVCTDTTRVVCRQLGEARLIDYSITVAATQGQVTFGDTKEGTMAVRTRPELNVDRKNPLASGTARNKEGLAGKAIWGVKSPWVDYQGRVGGDIVGLALFDHPSNLRHPTTWHARDYGLVAANPFGLHDFSKDQPKGAGDFVIPSGGRQTWRYGVYLYRGSREASDIDRAWAEWTGSKK